MHDAFFVELTNSKSDLDRIKFDELFGKSFLFLENLIQLTSADERHDEIKAGLGLEQVVHAD